MQAMSIEADELVTDALQLVVYLNQGQGKLILEDDVYQEVASFLDRYKQVSGGVQLEVFRRSGLYLGKLEKSLAHYQ